MRDAAAVEAPAAPAVATPKKVMAKKSGAVKKPATKALHPPVSEMVLAAITALKDRKGSSLQAIKKYVLTHYNVDLERQAIFIRKFLKAGVEKKIFLQTKGTGAAGRFKLAKAEGEKKTVKKPAVKKVTGEKKIAAKKPSVAKKPSAKPAAKKAVSEKVVKKPKSPKPAKKSGKAPTTKPKAPKPKKATAVKAKPAKK